MSLLVGKDGSPLVSDRSKEEGEKELANLDSRKKIYRLHPDVVAAIQNIVMLSFTTAEIEGMEVVNVSEEICEMMLETSDNDPTGTTITVNGEWYAAFAERMDNAAETIEEFIKQKFATLSREDSETKEEEDFPF